VKSTDAVGRGEGRNVADGFTTAKPKARRPGAELSATGDAEFGQDTLIDDGRRRRRRTGVAALLET